MAKREKIYEYVEINDETPIQKLTLGDQIRVLLKRLTYDPSAELKRDDAVSEATMVLMADCMEFIQKATEPIREGHHHNVIVAISSKFEPVLKDVLSAERIRNFYSVTVKKPIVDYDIPYRIEVKLEVR